MVARPVGWSGRAARGTPDGGNPLMHDRGKSDGPVVPAKLPNKRRGGGRGGGGGKGAGQGERGQQNAPRTQSRSERVK